MRGKGFRLRYSCCLCRVLYLFAGMLQLFLLPSVVFGEDAPVPAEIVRLVSPAAGSHVVMKRPSLKCVITEKFSPQDVLILLDGNDVTGVAEFTDDGFELRLIEILPPGSHTVSVTVKTSDGREVPSQFSFTSRHSESFEEVVSSNEVTLIYSALISKPDDVNSVPSSKIESNISTQTKIREKEWDLGVRANLRYLDQNIPVRTPENKGLNLVNYLITAKYTKDNFGFLSEIGDLNLQETMNTIQGLARRGGKISLTYDDYNLYGFVVNSKQYFGFRGGYGLEGTSDDHIMGLVGQTGLLSNKVNLKAIYVTGGEQGSSFGIYAPGGGKKGDVIGLNVKGDIIEQKLSAEAEVDFSSFDPDTSDEFDARNDKAWKLRLGGQYGIVSYEAVYDYMGPYYEVIGNPGLNKNREGLMLRSGLSYDAHMVNVTLSRYNDNVKKNPLFPRVYTYQGIVDYSFSKIPNMPIGLGYQKTILDSSMEPESTPELRTDTDVISGRIGYTLGELTLNFMANYSMQNDRTEAGNDTTAATYTFSPAYSMADLQVNTTFSLNSSTQAKSDVTTDTYTATLDLRGILFDKKVNYELAGTYNYMESSNGFMKQDTWNANFRVAYLLYKKIMGFVTPTIAVRGTYLKTNDMINDRGNDELILYFVFSTGIPFTL